MISVAADTRLLALTEFVALALTLAKEHPRKAPIVVLVYLAPGGPKELRTIHLDTRRWNAKSIADVMFRAARNHAADISARDQKFQVFVLYDECDPNQSFPMTFDVAYADTDEWVRASASFTRLDTLVRDGRIDGEEAALLLHRALSMPPEIESCGDPNCEVHGTAAQGPPPPAPRRRPSPVRPVPPVPTKGPFSNGPPKGTS